MMEFAIPPPSCIISLFGYYFLRQCLFLFYPFSSAPFIRPWPKASETCTLLTWTLSFFLSLSLSLSHHHYHHHHHEHQHQSGKVSTLSSSFPSPCKTTHKAHTSTSTSTSPLLHFCTSTCTEFEFTCLATVLTTHAFSMQSCNHFLCSHLCNACCKWVHVINEQQLLHSQTTERKKEKMKGNASREKGRKEEGEGEREREGERKRKKERGRERKEEEKEQRL